MSRAHVLGSTSAGLRHLASLLSEVQHIHEVRDIIHVVDKSGSPPLLPIFRSRQQAELLTMLLGRPDLEIGLSELASALDIPYSSAHREVERGESAGLLMTRRIGKTRLVRANVASPYFEGLSEILTRAFGPPAVIAEVLAGLSGVEAAYLYGSWAARFEGVEGQRPVKDIDLLVLGELDRDELYARIDRATQRLGRPVQVTIRDADWLVAGEGSFHDTVVSRPMVPIELGEVSAG
jgi:predicted nucleotidyltransferase